MGHVIALVVFLTPTGPIRTGGSHAVFPSREACELAVLGMTMQFELDRLMLEARHGQPVRYVTICHDLGVSA